MKNIILILIIIFTISSCSKNDKKLIIFAGSASKHATEEIIKIFEKETNIKVEIIFGGSGYVLTQMMMSQMGDIYFPGSSDYMEIAKNKNVVFPETEEKICYLIPSINVVKNNPKRILKLKDLLRKDLKIAMANPEGVCLGNYSVEIIENNFSHEEKEILKKNIINYTGSCSKTAGAISLKTVDAVLGWRVFKYWDKKNIENIKLDKSEIARIGYIPVAVSKFTKNKKNSKKFIQFLKSEKSKKIFKKYNYFVSKKQVFDYIGEEKKIGGVYEVPKNWIKKSN